MLALFGLTFCASAEEFAWDGRSSEPKSFWSSRAIPVTSGKTVRFDIDWLKRKWSFGSTARLLIRWENAAGRTIGDTRALWSNVKGCRNYELFEETTKSKMGVPIIWSTYHQIPDGAVFARIGFSFSGNPCRVELLKGTVTEIDPETRPWFTKAGGGERIEYGPSPFSDADVDEALKSRPRAYPKLVRHGDRIELEVNGERIYPAIRHSIKEADMSGVREFAKAGFRIQNVCIYVGEPTYLSKGEKPVLRDDGSFDVDYIERKVRQVLREDKDAYVMLVCKVSPTAAWKHQNIGELEQNEKGEIRVFATWRFSDDYTKNYPEQPGFGPIPSVFSEKFPKDVAASFAEAMRLFEKREVSKAVIGAFVTGGDDNQFRLQLDPWTSGLATRAFRSFLRGKYGSNAVLAQAWNRPDATFGRVKAPTTGEMLPDDEFVSSSPSPMSDFREFCSRTCVRMNSAFRGAVKQGAPRLLTGGYTCAMTLTGLEGRGRHAMADLLADANTDFVVWLPNYTRRRDEITAPLGMWAYNGSMLLHNKLMVTELDVRYPHAGHFGFPLYDLTLWQASHNDQTFSDFITYAGAMAFAWGGTFHAYPLDNRWYDYKGAMRAWARAVEVSRNAWGQELTSDRIAVFYDDRATDFNSYSQKNVCMPAARTLQTGDALWRTGVRFDNYLLEDVLTDDFATVAPKVMLINDPTTLTPEKIRAIRKRYAKDGRILLWVGAPGLHSGHGADEISAALGFVVSRASFKRPIVTVASNDSLVRGLDRYWFETTVGFDTVHPTGWAIGHDDGIQELARYEDTEVCGAAVRRSADCTEILVGAPGSVTPRFLRNVCRAARIRPIIESDDFFVTGGHLMVIGAPTRSGKRRIHLPKGARTLRSITGQAVVPVAKDLVEVSLSCGSVGVFSIIESPDPQVNRPDFTCYVPRQPYVEMARDRSVLDPTLRGDSYNDHFQVIADKRRACLHAFWTQASWEGAEDQHIAYSRSADGGRTWTDVIVLAGSETRAAPHRRASWQQPMLSKSGRLYCLWNQQTTDLPPHCGELYGRYSDDGGETWGEVGRVPFDRRMDADPEDPSVPPSWCNWQRPLRLGENGRFLVGCSRHGKAPYDDRYGCKVEFWQFDNLDEIKDVKDLKISYFATDRKAFSATSLERLGGFLASEPAVEEAGLVKLPDGRLFALMRSSVGSPVWAQSRDAGRTWSDPKILLDENGKPIPHPRSPCPIYDWDGCEAASGLYFALVHNMFDFGNTKGNAYQKRGPLYLIAGKFDPVGDQPIRFSAPKPFAMRNSGNAFYTSYTKVNGRGVLWFNDLKYYLYGRYIGSEWMK